MAALEPLARGHEASGSGIEAYLLDANPAPAYAQDAAGTIRAANPPLAVLIGKDRGDLVGRKVGDVFGPSVGEALAEQDAEVIDTRGHCAREHVIAASDGPRSVKVHKMPIHDAQGGLVAIVTELRVAETPDDFEPPAVPTGLADLPFLTDFDRSLLAHHRDGIAIIANGRPVFVNETISRWLGRSPDDLLGQPPSAFLAPEDLGLARDRALLSRHGQSLGPAEYSLLAADGSRVPVEVVSTHYRRGEDLIIVAVARRLRERTAGAEVQRYHLRYLEAMDRLTRAASSGDEFEDLSADLLDELLHTFDCDRVVLLTPCNPAAGSYRVPMCRYREGFPPPFEPGEIRPLSDAVRNSMRRVLDSDTPIVASMDDQQMTSGAEAELDQWQVRTLLACSLHPAHGSPSLLGLHRCREARPWAPEDIDLLRDLTPRMADLIGTCFLLDELRESERMLQQAVVDLGRSNAELERFAHVASHDLKEPLRAVANSVQLLRRRFVDSTDPEAIRLAQHAVDGAFRMAEMINGLLAYSRAGTQPLTLGPVDLGGALEHVLQDLQPLIDETEANVVVGDMPVVRGEERLLEQLLQNLLSNALKFRGEEPPVVRVSARREADAWVVTVEDNGMGFGADDASRIFDIFETLGSGRDASGTGLGLALCQRIVQRLGGSIWAWSEPGSGAAFHFSLPPAKT
ncbi:MAG: PAS domain-containing protein [Armatimonadia bacterium]|nr:PAS domain-containing protein [Armatimonadia bacterium]